MPEGARPIDDGSGDPGTGHGPVDRDAGVMEDSLEGECGPETGVFDNKVVFPASPDGGSQEKKTGSRHGEEDLATVQPTGRGEKKNGPESTGEDEKKDQSGCCLEEEKGPDIPESGKSDQERRNDEGKPPAREGSGLEAFPEEEGPMGQGEGKQPSRIPAAIERNIGGDRHRKGQHQEKTEKEDMNEPIAEQGTCRRESGHITETGAEKPVGGAQIADQEKRDGRTHQP